MNVVRRPDAYVNHEIGAFCSFVARFYSIGMSDCMMQNNIHVDLIGGVVGHETDVSRMNQSLTLSSPLKTVRSPLRSNLQPLVKHKISKKPKKWVESKPILCVRLTENRLPYTMPPTAPAPSGLQTPTPSMAAPFPVQTSQTRTQPWKKHWPPKLETDTEKAYGFKEGAPIVIYGN